jgi:hypothetical protein
MNPTMWPPRVLTMSTYRKEQIAGNGGFLSVLGFDNLEDAVILFAEEHPEEAKVFIDWLQDEGSQEDAAT